MVPSLSLPAPPQLRTRITTCAILVELRALISYQDYHMLLPPFLLQIMMLECIISAYTLSALSLEGARSSERQMMASSWPVQPKQFRVLACAACTLNAVEVSTGYSIAAVRELKSSP